MKSITRLLVSILVVFVAGCTSEPGAGPADATDATSFDAGAHGDAMADARIVDAGGHGDTGAPDAGTDAGVDAAIAEDAMAVCLDGGTRCGSACIDTTSDVHHCGDCAIDCALLPGVDPTRVTCTAGACDLTNGCATGRAHCTASAADGCETDITTAAHCGSCGASCSDPTPLCTAGASGYTCASGCSGATPSRCGSSCVDLSTSAANCSACGAACPVPANASAMCTGGVCGFTCDAGYHACGSSCVSSSDPATCGTSCSPCPAPANGSATCIGFACGITCDAGFHACGGACVADDAVATCGTLCSPCPSPTNGTATCVLGRCGVSCATGYHACGLACVDDASVTQCGTSCATCPVPSNGAAACIAGACELACDPGFHGCSGDCVDDTSTSSCGTSCTSCPMPLHGTAVCTGGTCGSLCDAGFHACSGACVGDGSVTACGASCTTCTTPANATATCVGGACGYVCNAGFLASAGACVPGPRPIAPLSTAIVATRQPTLRWELPPGLPDVTLDLCLDRACTLPIGAPVYIAGTSFTPSSDLPTGVVFWRLHPSTSTTLTGPTWQFTVGARSAAVDTSWGTVLDVDGDGYADIVAGAPGAYPTGQVYVYRGGPGGPSATASTTLQGPGGPYDYYGGGVASAGDTNGDGFADVAVAAPNAPYASGAGPGLVYLYLGGPSGLATSPSLTLTGPDGNGSYFGGYAGGTRGAVASAGDTNGDGYADLIVGAVDVTVAGSYGTGRAHLYLGGPLGVSTTPDLTLEAPVLGGSFGWSVAQVGDIDGDGHADVAIGAYRAGPSYEGRVYVYRGSATGLEATPVTTLPSPGGPSGWFGTSIASANDVDGDGLADLIVGASNASGGAGAAYVFTSLASGITTPSAALANPISGGGYFGVAVAGAGDVDGDGYADVAVGSSCSNTVYDVPCAIGYAYVYLGGGAGLATTPATSLTGPDGYHGYFGLELTGAGDLDGDHLSDAVIGAPGRGHGFVFPGVTGGVASAPSLVLTGSGVGTSLARVDGLAPGRAWDASLVDERACGHPLRQRASRIARATRGAR